jgi:predicted ATPase
MKITSIEKYKSITKFNDFDFKTNFVILTGCNGSSKTHLLKSIELDNSRIDEGLDSVYFNFQDFLISNQSSASSDTINNSWAYAHQSANNFIRGSEGDFPGIVLDSKLKSYLVNPKEKPYNSEDDNIKNGYEESYKELIASIRSKLKDKNNYSQDVKSKIKKFLNNSDLLVSDESCNEDYFMKVADTDQIAFSLQNSLSEIFLLYKIKLNKVTLSVEDGGQGLTESQLSEYEANAPWNIINRQFKALGLEHRINEPKFVLGDHDRKLTFEAKIYIDDMEISFEDLSSGEKVLCALSVVMFQGSRDLDLPDLLLLDEIDASLHPTNVPHLYNAIKEVFVDRGVKVIMATHSPTTVARAEEYGAKLFEVVKGVAPVKIKKIDVSDALAILTDGFMTLEEGLNIFQNVIQRNVIISEGKNSKYFKGLVDLIGKSSDIAVVGHHNISDGALRNIFDVQKVMNSTKNVLYIWDCDYQKAAFNGNKHNKPIILEKYHSNKYLNRGIEASFDENRILQILSTSEKSLNMDDILEEIKEKGTGTVIGKGLSPKYKKRLLRNINNFLTDDFIELNKALQTFKD